jgi:hypothetical protein
MNRGIPFLARIAAVLLVGTITANATNRVVSNLNDSGSGSLRNTIAASADGDSITFGVMGTITLTSGQLVIGKSITISGPGANVLSVARSSDPSTPEFNVLLIFNGGNSGPTVSISGLTLAGGKETNGTDGAGIYNAHGKLTLTNCIVRDNTTTNNGGGIYNDGTGSGASASLTINSCVFYRNFTNGNGTQGGAIYHNGSSNGNATLTVTNSTFSSNSSHLGGGAIYQVAIFGGTATSTVTSCTLVNNSNSSGRSIDAGSIEANGGTVTVRNSILGTNSATNLIANGGANIVSSGYNLSDRTNDAGFLTGPGDQINTQNIGTDFAGLVDNGGPVPTVALVTGSPALDAGKSFGLTTDARGHQRPFDLSNVANAAGGDGSDIGAYEADDQLQVGLTLTVNVTSDHADGICGSADCTLREAVLRMNELHNHFAANNPYIINFAPGVLGTISIQLALGTLNLTGGVTINGPGARILAVSGNTNHRVFSFSGPGIYTVNGLTIRDGWQFASSGTGQSAMGAGVRNDGALIFNDCGFVFNRTGGASNTTAGGNGGDGFGGAIFNTAALTVNRCIFTTNQAFGGNGGDSPHMNNLITIGGKGGSGLGAAIYNDSAGTLTITNSTFSDNSAGGGKGGNADFGGNGGTASAGVFNLGTANCTAVTLSGNTGTGGSFGTGNNRLNNGSVGSGRGGLTSNAGTFTVRNTLSAGNTGNFGGGPDANGPFNSLGFNLLAIGDGSTGFNATGDQVGTTAAAIDARLGSLQNNGGPTDTRALLDNSPALDGGHSSGLSTDQRGSSRTIDAIAYGNPAGGDGTDIGSFERTDVGPLVTPTPTPVPGTLANISTRLRVETGDNALIGGFIVTGTQSKKVIVRAIGPSLPFAGVLADPTLELYQGNTLLESNDNWVDSPNKQAIIDSTIPPSNSLESAIVRTLSANNTGYTAIVRGANNGTGIGVVEAYDLDRTADSKLANISTRGFVSGGDNVLIAGTIVLGQAVQKVIVRALGPSLTVPGKLGDPTLELRNANGDLVRANDNWRMDGQEAEIIATTIPPTNDSESALVENLSSNGASYTAIVRGVGGTTGIAVVELYALN